MGFNQPFDGWERERGKRRHGNSWLIGLILIAIGVLFLLQNAGIAIGGNWWALFIMIPAIAAGAAAWSMFERAGRKYTPSVNAPLSGFVLLTFVAAMLFFSLSWSLWWPVFIIIVGLSALLGRVGRQG
jgi:hypothetical protein